MRRILLIDPVFHVHSPTQYRAALASEGFEDAQFVILTGGIGERDRDRMSEFARGNPRAEVRELGNCTGNLTSRWQAHKAYSKAVHEAEEILRAEAFDFFAYLMLDNALP